MIDQYALAFAGIVGAGIGIIAGMSWQWKRSEAYIKRQWTNI